MVEAGRRYAQSLRRDGSMPITGSGSARQPGHLRAGAASLGLPLERSGLFPISRTGAGWTWRGSSASRTGCNLWLPTIRTMDEVFKALADASRRSLLDRLHARNGQTLNELCDGLAMTRQAVTKHLADSRSGQPPSPRSGMAARSCTTSIPFPIHQIGERWIRKFERGKLAALSELKRQLEKRDE